MLDPVDSGSTGKNQQALHQLGQLYWRTRPKIASKVLLFSSFFMAFRWLLQGGSKSVSPVYSL